MRLLSALQRAAIAGLALPPDLRARIEILRDRAATRAGLTLTCGGLSMQPALRLGQEVRVRAGAPRRGAVAAFVTGRGAIELHRLLLSTGGVGWWVHAGDSQVSAALGLVHASQIVGIADLPVVTPGAVVTARAAARLARAAIRLTRSSVRGRASAAAGSAPGQPR